MPHSLNDTESMTPCAHCGEKPLWVNASPSRDEVHWALRCECKSTPYMRRPLEAVERWENMTHSETIEVALAAAQKETPDYIEVKLRKAA